MRDDAFVDGYRTGMQVSRKVGEARQYRCGYLAGEAVEQERWERRLEWVGMIVGIIGGLTIIGLSLAGML